MLKNYFKIALRNLKRSKAYTLINVLGLALGIACAILTFTLVKYHLSFDTFHSKAERIYRVTTELHQEEISYTPGTPQPLGKAFQDDYNFAEKVARVASYGNQLISIPSSKDNLKFQEEAGVAFAEPEFFDILDFPLVQGDKNTVLTEPNTAIITERIAKKYFGSQDPLGQTIRVNNKWNYRITGILRDLPVNTDRRQEIYLSYNSLKELDPWLASDDSWSAVLGNMHCFVLLKPNILPNEVDKVFPTLSKKYYNKQDANIYQFKLQHISDIHFNTDLDGYVSKRNLGALSIIGIFLIITACVNFINLATAQALGRSKEIGVRKVLGSYPRQLFWQFIAETTVIAVLALVLAFILAQLALPSVNQLFDTQLKINPFHDIYLLVFLPVLLLVVILLSGSYPGLILAGFQPILALKGKLSQRHVGGFSLKRGLVVTQFAISQLLIIATIVITSQIRYSTQTDLGFQKEAVAILSVPDNEKSKISTFNSEVSQIAGVEKVTFFSDPPSSGNLNTYIRFASRTEDEKFTINFKAGDDQYVPTFDLQIVAGRNLHPSDTVREFLLNETAVKKLNVQSNQDVIGRKMHLAVNNFEGIIVGVVKDFHNKSFHEAIDPLCITTPSDWYSKCALKINPASLVPTLKDVEMVWKTTFPDHAYKYDFLDEQIARFYEQERVMLRLIQIFAGIAIIIGCLGLYGLVSFMAAQKTKEVGVRKVLGASVENIVWLFGKEFARLLLIAFVIVAPLAWWVMNNWLDNFAYRIRIGAGIFALAILITLVVAILTVGYRSVKAALMDPVESLRSE